ncbi:MAG: type II secretion system F family protein, partial [Sphingobacteriaceae bacterium]
MASIDLSKYHSGKKISVDRTIDGNGIVEFLQSDITLFQKKFGAKEKEAFYSELGLLLSTGIDIKKAFDIIKEDIKDKGHRKIIDEIDNRIISGMSVYESIKAQHKVFSSYEFESVRIGEESGKLPEVLIELGQYYKSGIQLKRQIVGV